MKQNHVRAKLKRGEPSVGTWLTLPDSVSARLMARVGFDWLTVELEHTPVNFETAAQSFTVIAGNHCVPLARVPWNTGENIKRVLDTGAYGIVVPMVNSRAEAEAAVRAARYQPLGERSIGGQLHAANFDTDPATYYARANEEILVVVMMEHIKAIEAADQILSVPGIDVAFIGPNDLSNSMGKKPVFDSDDKEFKEAVAHVLATARKHGVAPGIHVLDAPAAQRRLGEGFQFIAITSEAGMMLAKAGEIAKILGLGADKVVAKY
ncbi:MAG TPA: aldolase/citrate lyase family protein [Verrucomicrobiae bacterium]|nr:aldolase/citrate lyase family protein [Verrucomicrobiae bacterium]